MGGGSRPWGGFAEGKTDALDRRRETRYALDRLIARRKIRPADVARALRDRKKEIEEIRRRLAELEGVGGRLRLARQAATRRGAARHTKRKISAQARARLRLQSATWDT